MFSTVILYVVIMTPLAFSDHATWSRRESGRASWQILNSQQESTSPAKETKDLSEAERKKIEHLIEFVEKMTDAKFVRNGQEHDAKDAAKFIRAKWNSNSESIKTAKDFIDKAASVSSTTGKPYLIRFKDGKEVKSGAYLNEELAKFEKQSP